LARLAAPLQKFIVPVVTWRPNALEFQEYKKERVTYRVPDLISIAGREWYCVTACNVDKVAMGNVLLPLKYYPLWRRLIYGALLQEKMFEAWRRGQMS
jgi:hypothetical protein